MRDCGLWTKFTQDNISNAFQEEQSTNDLRSDVIQSNTNNGFSITESVFCVWLRMLVERVLLDTTDDLRVQCSHVEQAFSQRCMELTGARSQLEMKLATVNRQKYKCNCCLAFWLLRGEQWSVQNSPPDLQGHQWFHPSISVWPHSYHHHILRSLVSIYSMLRMWMSPLCFFERCLR